MKRTLKLAAALVAVASCLPPALTAAATSADSVQFSDGAVGTAYPHCGDTDLCAVVSYPGGDTLRIYSEGAARGQPYILHFVRLLGNTLLYEYSRTLDYNWWTNRLTMDHGLIHLDVLQNSDGTLTLRFSRTG